MPNLAITRNPSNWEEYMYHDIQVKLIQGWIKSNNLPNAIYVSGPTGVGKTSAVSLLIKSILCQNRKAGEYEPCGVCNSCKLDPRTAGAANNVVWIQTGNAEATINAQVNYALEEALQPPNGFAEEHRYWKFIVVDELQSVPRNTLQNLLFYPELNDVVSRNRVVFIFITMEESRLDPVVRSALASRCERLYFKALTKQQIKDFVKYLNPDIPEDSLEMISLAANGSMRDALNRFDTCTQIDPLLNPTVVADVLFFADAETRQTLWELLEACESRTKQAYNQLWEFWKALSERVDAEFLLMQMDNDIDKSLLINPNEEQLIARHIIYTHHISRAKCNVWDVIKQLAGRSIISYEIFKVFSEPSSGLNRLLGVELQ